MHYVLPEGRSAGEHRPAIVVRLWEPGGGSTGYAQLQVFTDAGNDGMNPVEWKTSVLFDENGKPGTWHWPERE